MLKLHFAPASRAERVLWLLEELELPYAVSYTHLRAHET